MQTLYVPKYGIHYRVNPKDPCELQWSKKPFGPLTSWQHAMTFKRPIRALDVDDETQQGVVVLNDSSTYVGSGVRVWGRKYYTAGSRIYSLYSIGESKMSKMTIRVHEKWNPDAAKHTIGEYRSEMQRIVNTKVYNLVATTPEGYELNGRIKCFAAGTKEAPFDRYDMTVEIY